MTEVFTEWHGTGPVPLPDDVLVVCKLRGGDETDARAVCNLNWGHRKVDPDIVGYRIVAANEWVEHRINFCPVTPATIVNLFLANGTMTGPLTAGNVQWDVTKCQPGLGIKFYRVVEVRPGVREPGTPQAADTFPVKGYERLAAVYMAAYDQAANGKGKERHAKDDVPFERQPMTVINETLGSIDGFLYQAHKKSTEAKRLPKARAIAELYGAINYLAGAVIYLENHARDE